MIVINKEFIKKFDPCKSGWENYLKHYEEWEGTLLEFMDLEHISDKDKVWMFSRKIEGIEKLQRKFAVYCMNTCKTEIKEISYFQKLITELYESTNYESIEYLKGAAYKAAHHSAYEATSWAADHSAYEAAYWAAAHASYKAAYWAADYAAQIEKIKDLLTKGLNYE